MTKDISFIKTLIEPYFNYPVECDGMTRIVHSVLHHNKIPHTTYIGYLSYKNESLYHWWCEHDGFIIDYRTKMWFDYPDVPQGIFKVMDYPEIKYEGHISDLPVLSLIGIDLLFKPI